MARSPTTQLFVINEESGSEDDEIYLKLRDVKASKDRKCPEGTIRVKVIHVGPKPNVSVENQSPKKRRLECPLYVVVADDTDYCVAEIYKEVLVSKLQAGVGLLAERFAFDHGTKRLLIHEGATV